MKVSPRFLSRCLPALALALLALGVLPDAAGAETSVLQLGTIYRCPAGKSFKVLSCAGSADTNLCDVQSYNHGQPEMRGKSTHQQVMGVLPICHIQTPGETQAVGHPGATQEDGTNGIKVGDAVEVVTGSGWTRGKVVAVNGNSYRVLVYGVQVTKDYPAEVRRLGAASARDHAQGQYRLGDRVEVNVGGRSISGRIVTEMGQDYQVELPGNRTAWATPNNLRPAHTGPGSSLRFLRRHAAEARTDELRGEVRGALCQHRRLWLVHADISVRQGHDDRRGRQRRSVRVLDGRRQDVPAQARCPEPRHAHRHQ